MKKTIKSIVASVLIVPALLLGVSAFLPATTPVSAQWTLQGSTEVSQGDGQPSELFGDSGIFTTIINILLFIIGVVAVIMLIIGGIRYVVSGGDQAAVTAAKNTILYAVIGIIIAILAYAIVNFVIVGLAEV